MMSRTKSSVSKMTCHQEKESDQGIDGRFELAGEGRDLSSEI